MKYNIIGDIHGRTCWKQLIVSDAINIFVGDYFSPYHKAFTPEDLQHSLHACNYRLRNQMYDLDTYAKKLKGEIQAYVDSFRNQITWEQQKQNFLDIIAFKKEHPETILLVGNHDEDHWHWRSYYACSRHDYEHEDEIRSMFEQNKDLFQAAYSIENKALVTHAGLSILWLFRNEHGKENLWCCHVASNLNAPCFYDYATIEDAYQAYKTELETERPGWKMNEPRKWELHLWKNRWYYWNDGFHEFQITPNEAANYVNEMWHKHPELFAFRVNADHDDDYGTTPRHSPMWIRIGNDDWSGLNASSIFKGTEYTQIFGHTLDNHIQEYYDELYDGEYWYDTNTGHMVMVDCLEYKTESYIFET